MMKNLSIKGLITILILLQSAVIHSQEESPPQPEKAVIATVSALFGHDLFKSEPGTYGFSTSFHPESYNLGPGDKIGIFLSGKIQEDFSVIVNVEGKIHIPTVGVLNVNGMKLTELRSFLIRKLSRFYDNFRVDVMLIEPKSVQVSVVGEVSVPGKYVLTAQNTVIDALSMAGGPSLKGSLRDVRLIRNGVKKTSVDFYDFLLNPDFKDFAFLESGDRIYVPLMEGRVQIHGEVKRNKTFELKPGADERLSDIIILAGGFTDYAYLKEIELSRVQQSGERRVMYIDYEKILEEPGHPSNAILKNDDVIRIYSKLDQIEKKVVHIHGEVRRPGTYPLEEELKLSDLILKSGNLKRNAYMLEAEIAKIDPKQPTQYLKVDLQQLMVGGTGDIDPVLEADDRVFIREIPEWNVGPTVEVQGEMMFPGTYSITKDSTKLSEILEKAGGFTNEALVRESKLVRKSARIIIDKEYDRLKQMSREDMTSSEYQYLVMKENTQDIGQVVVDFYKLAVRKDRSEDVLLKDGDVILVPKRPHVVYVTGRISRPGGIMYVSGKKLKYYLGKAGGASWDAHLRKIKVTKVTGEILDDEDVDRFEPGDIIWVPRKPDRDWWEVFRQTIAVAAQVATVYLVVDRAVN
ncbi:MAG: SLBB domain-containing protein [candidate division KSB1 bacterium]|jgi:protein involved in polysaccharide export with SLBB domain|nr:SLBB domain-containing protein [candidate division KSB1 bacterium]